MRIDHIEIPVTDPMPPSASMRRPWRRFACPAFSPFPPLAQPAAPLDMGWGATDILARGSMAARLYPAARTLRLPRQTERLSIPST